MTFNHFLSAVSLTLFATLAYISVRDARHLIQGRLLAAMSVSIGANQLAQLTDSVPLTIGCYFVGLPDLSLLWWFCLSLLRDDFALNKKMWAGFAALLVVSSVEWIVALLFSVDEALHALGTLDTAVSLVMVAHLFFVVVAERRGDVIEPRRRARLWMAFVIIVALAVVLFAQFLGQHERVDSLMLLVIVSAEIAVLHWLVGARPEKLVFEPDPVLRPHIMAINPKDVALHQRLTHAIDTERIFLKESLSIEDLAKHLQVPAHQLRALINTQLGFRNFSAFLNHHRLAHAKHALSDINRARDTVQMIAYESGFASLQTFNRVFKELEGVAPTVFRSAELSKASQS